MSLTPTKHIDGDLAIGRNISCGGNANIQGNARIGHNLIVEGWLDAPNIKGPEKGMFESADYLMFSYPHPDDGWWALVGTSLPADIYVARGGVWRPTGSKGGEIIVDSTGTEVHNVVFFDSVDTENALNVSDEDMTAVLNRTDYAPADAPTVMTWRDSRFFAKVGDVFYEKFPGSRQFGAQNGKGIAPKPGVLYVSKSGSDRGRLFVSSDSGGWRHLEQVELDLRRRVEALELSTSRCHVIPNVERGNLTLDIASMTLTVKEPGFGVVLPGNGFREERTAYVANADGKGDTTFRFTAADTHKYLCVDTERLVANRRNDIAECMSVVALDRSNRGRYLPVAYVYFPEDPDARRIYPTGEFADLFGSYDVCRLKSTAGQNLRDFMGDYLAHRYSNPVGDMWHRNLSIMHISDIHQAWDRMNEALTLARWTADLIVDTGDVSQCIPSDGEEKPLRHLGYYNNRVTQNRGDVPLLTAQGNHDLGVGKEAYYNAMVAAMVERSGGEFTPGRVNRAYGSYRPAEAPSGPFRVIILDPWDRDDTATGENWMEVCFSQVQIDWLTAQLAAARDNGEHVITMMHYAFGDSERWRDESVNPDCLFLQDPFMIPEIIEAFQKGIALRKTYTGGPEDVTVDVAAADRRLNYAAHLFGHIHSKNAYYCGKADGSRQFDMLMLGETALQLQGTAVNVVPRQTGTVNEIALSLLEFDFNTGVVYRVSYGAYKHSDMAETPRVAKFHFRRGQIPLTVGEQLEAKVDKAEGKGLSTNDYTDDEKRRVANIPTVQTSYNGSPVNYIYSVQDSSDARNVVTTRNTLFRQGSGHLQLQIGHWATPNDSGRWTAKNVPVATASADGAMSKDVFSRLGTGASIYESTAAQDSVTVSYPNWASGGNRTFTLNAATTARAGVMTVAMVKRLSAAEAAANDALEASAALSGEVEALRQQVYDVTTRPQMEAELTAMGWNPQQIEAAFATHPQMTRGQLELRRGLLGLNYTVTEVEECMEDVPALTQDDIDYARSLMEAWDPATTDMTESYKGDTRIVVFPKIDTSNVTRMHRTWGGCTNMRYMPLLDVSASTYCMALFTEEETDNIVPLRRLPAFDFASMTGPANGRPLVDLAQVEIIPHIRFKGNANMWNVFNGCKKVREFGGIECDWETVREIAQMFSQWKSFDHLPLTNLHKCSGNNIQLFSSLGEDLPEPVDLSGEALTADEGVEISLMRMFRWANLCGLPRLDISAVSSMESAFEGITEYTVMPDYSHLRPTNVAYLVGSNSNSCKIERIEGLNFERVTSMDHMLAHSNSNGRCPNLQYIRIINLGKSGCTTYPFYSAENWGADSAGNLQSLVDTLLTDSYDRAAASMATATVKLPAATLARLTEEQKAAITAKGYTLVQI